VAQFTPLFAHFAHFAQSCAAADPSRVEQDELEEEKGAKSFGLVFDALFARVWAEMPAIAAEFGWAQLPLCLLGFLRPFGLMRWLCRRLMLRLIGLR
jgi:hypothetical protein